MDRKFSTMEKVILHSTVIIIREKDFAILN